MNKVKINKGQSLFEVVFAIGVMALITVAIVSVSTISIRNNIASKNKALANKYVNEGMEWLRSIRDEHWEDFRAHGGQPQGQNLRWNDFCMAAIPPGNWGQSGSNPPQSDPCEPNETISNTQFYRTYSLARDFPPNSETTVHAKVTVEWTDGLGVHQSSTITNFTNWQ